MKSATALMAPHNIIVAPNSTGELRISVENGRTVRCLVYLTIMLVAKEGWLLEREEYRTLLGLPDHHVGC
jgi:hypothetical protein